MPKPRRQQVSPEATPYYHCISRCVRRAFLCCQDHATSRSFDHRKQWLVERMEELAAIFAVDICSYGVLSNHPLCAAAHKEWLGMNAQGESGASVPRVRRLVDRKVPGAGDQARSTLAGAAQVAPSRFLVMYLRVCRCRTGRGRYRIPVGVGRSARASTRMSTAIMPLQS
jgi:hypothetical protein